MNNLNDAPGTKPGRQTRALNETPAVRPTDATGRVLAVELSGALGAGRVFRIDEADWHYVTASHGAAWGLVGSGDGYGSLYVRKHRAAGGAVTLARLLAGAQPGEVVSYFDGDPLNLTRCNLLVSTRAEAARRAVQAARSQHQQPATGAGA